VLSAFFIAFTRLSASSCKKSFQPLLFIFRAFRLCYLGSTAVYFFFILSLGLPSCQPILTSLQSGQPLLLHHSPFLPIYRAFSLVYPSLSASKQPFCSFQPFRCHLIGFIDFHACTGLSAFQPLLTSLECSTSFLSST
jgi:hypothetical protein